MKTSLSIHREFFQFVSFSVLSMMGQSLFILADTYFIANGVGAKGLAALNIVLPVANIINGLGWMFGVGGATQFAFAKSQKRQEEANHHFTQTMLTASLVALLFALLSQLWAEQVLGFLGVTTELYEMSYSYFSILTLFAPFFILNNTLITFIRNDYNPRLAMIGMILGGIINIIFDYIFIYPLNMGLTGAAIATVFSPAVSLLVCSLHFKYGRQALAFRPIHLQAGSFFITLRNGFSSFLNEFSSAVVMLIFNLIILGLADNIGVAAYSIVANMNIIAIAIFTGVGQGLQPLVSIYHGQKNGQAVQTVLRLGLITALAVGFFFMLIGFAVPDVIVAIFNGDNHLQLAQLAEPGVRLYFTSFLFTGVNFTLIYYLSAINEGNKSMLISALRGLLLVYPVVFGMSQYFSLTGVWLSMTIVEILTLISAVVMLRKTSFWGNFT